MAIKYEEEIYPAIMDVHCGFQGVVCRGEIREIPALVCIWWQEGTFVTITWHSLQ